MRPKTMSSVVRSIYKHDIRLRPSYSTYTLSHRWDNVVIPGILSNKPIIVKNDEIIPDIETKVVDVECTQSIIVETPLVITEYVIEEKLDGAQYAIHGDKIVMVGYNHGSCYFYVNGKKVTSRSVGTTLREIRESLRISCCDKYFAVTYRDNYLRPKEYHSTTILLNYEGNIIWLGEKRHTNNIDYADIHFSDKYGLLIAYYGELLWLRFDNSHNQDLITEIYTIETNKSIRCIPESGVRWTSNGNIVLAQEYYVRIYKLGDNLTQIGNIPYELLFTHYNIPGMLIMSKLNINSEDEIYYCCGDTVYHRKLDGTLISKYSANGSEDYTMYNNNGLYWNWCYTKDHTVTLFSIASDKISKWNEYLKEEARKEEQDGCIIS